MTDDSWNIEGEFRDGSERIRRSDGRYQSVSTAILEEVSEYEVVSESGVAARLGIDETVALEHLLHLKQKGLIEGREGAWSKESEFPADAIPRDEEHAFPWEERGADDESTY